MTAYLLTAEQHAQLVDALTTRDLRLHEKCEATLKAMKPQTPVGWWDTIDGGDFTYSIGELCGGPTDGLKPLYTLGDTA